MHKIDTPTAHNGSFVDPVPQQGTAGTVVDASWLNAVQNEIANAILGANIALDKTKNNQLFTAVQNLIDKTCERNVLSGLELNDEIGTTEQIIGSEIEILYDNVDWFISASIVIDITTAASSGDLTVYLKSVYNNQEYTVFSFSIPATSQRSETVPLDLNVPYLGQIKFTVVADATCEASIIVQGYTSVI